MRACPFVETFAIEEFLRPLGAAQFFDAQWEKQWCVLRGASPERFSGLLELSDIEHILADRETPLDGVILVGGRTGEAPAATGGVSLLDTMLKGFAAGRTILVRAAQRRLPRLAALSAHLEKALGMRVHLNLYLTPADSQGFEPHFDIHDVFVMQISGSKHWRVGGQIIALPLPEQAPDGECSMPPDAAMLTLGPGDILYIPRGILHEAWSTGEASLHITVGLNNVTLLDVAIAGLRAAALRDERWRRGLPPGTLLAGDRAGLAEDVLALCREAVGKPDIITAVDHMAHQFIGARAQPSDGSLRTMASLGDLEGRFRLRPEVLLELVDKPGGRLSIVFAGREVDLPVRVREAVELCVSGRAFELADLPGELDAEERAVLVRRLLREGLLETAR